MLGVGYLRQVVKSPSFSSLSSFAGSNILVSIIAGLGGLLQARWLDPATFGEFQQYGILAGYMGIGVIVVNDGLIRQYPYYIGKGDIKKALEVAGVAKWWYLIVASAMSGIMAVCMFYAMLCGNWRATVGWGAWIVISWMNTYGNFLGIMYRTSSDFKRLSANNLIASVYSFFALAFVRLWGYCGIAIRLASVAVFTIFLHRRYLPVKIKAVWKPTVLKQLSEISLKFALPAYFHSTGLTATKNALALYFCEKEGLGVFAMAVSFCTLAQGFSNALNQIFNVKIATRFGATESVRGCFMYSLRPALLGIALSMAIALGCGIAIDPFISIFLPKYAASIPVIKILLIGLVIMAMALPLLVIKAALMWKTAAVQAFSNFTATLLLIIILPKTPIHIAIATVAGGLVEVAIGYLALLLLAFRNSA